MIKWQPIKNPLTMTIKENDVKAYTCGPDHGDSVDLIFAETASKARYYSFCLEESSGGCDLIEINVRRAKDADKFYNGEGKTYSCYEVEPMRAAYMHDYNGVCYSCERCPFPDYKHTHPEWQLCDECNYCGECGCECEDEKKAQSDEG